MADQMPPNGPLDDRLRATFAAEHADIERRHLASGAVPTPARSLKWIPFAVAAAVIVGFLFVGNRSSDQAVELDIAAQTTDSETPESEVPGESEPEPTEAIPFQTGVDMCGDNFDPPTRTVVTPDDNRIAVLEAPGLDDDTQFTRTLRAGDLVELTGGCAAAKLDDGVVKWYEIVGAPGAANDWIRSDYVGAETGNAQPVQEAAAANECDAPVIFGPHFVWNVGIDDPDGGLIAHTEVGVATPTTRVLRFDEVVHTTGGCRVSSNGSPWYQLESSLDSGFDWVNSRYLQAAEPACLQGERLGSQHPSGDLIHTVAAGETLGLIAQQYDMTLEQLLAANPGPQVTSDLAVGDPLWIRGWTGPLEPVFGPLDGYTAVDLNRAAFASVSDSYYRWYRVGDISMGASCTELLEVDTFEAQPCMRVAQPGTDSLDSVRTTVGETASTADHVHGIRTGSNATCTRVVITFGDNANESLDIAAAVLPPVNIDQRRDSVRVTANGWRLESAFGDPDRIAYPGGIGLLTLTPDFQLAVELMHADMEPSVRVFTDPARIVIDLFPVDDPASEGPFGERFVLRAPIQSDRFGPGIPADTDIVVSGFGRPFEAAGLYRLWEVPADVDADAFLANPPAPLIEDFFPTAGWAEGWGQFDVTLPDLAAGTYIAVFGELPPTDEIGFYGTGQLFRVTDAPTGEPGSWPEAVLLPDVQLPPE